MPRSLQKRPLTGWPRQKVSTSPYPNTLLASSIPPSFMHVLLYPILSFYIWRSFSPRTNNFTHFLHKLFTILSLNMAKLHQSFFFFFFFSPSIPLHHTSLHLHKIPCHTFHTRSHCESESK